MAQYEIEVDSQDEYYDSSTNTSTSKIVDNLKVVRSVVKRKGRGFSAEEPSTQVLGGIKHFDTVKEEVSGGAMRCKTDPCIFMYFYMFVLYILYYTILYYTILYYDYNLFYTIL